MMRPPRLLSALALAFALLPGSLAGAQTPLYAQELADSCGPACLRMMIDAVRQQQHAEREIRDVCRTVPQGYGHPQRTEPGMSACAMPEVLRRFGVPSELIQGELRYRDLQQHTPAIVRLKMTGDQGHFVLVDRVTCVAADGRNVNWRMEIYDPDPGQRYTLPGHIFASCYGDSCVWHTGQSQLFRQPGQGAWGSGAGRPRSPVIRPLRGNLSRPEPRRGIRRGG